MNFTSMYRISVLVCAEMVDFPTKMVTYIESYRLYIATELIFAGVVHVVLMHDARVLLD